MPYNILTFLIFLFLFIPVQSLAESNNALELAELYFESSGLDAQVRQVPLLIKSGFEKGRGNNIPLSDNEFNGLIKIISKAFQASRAKDAVTAQLTTQLNEKELNEVIRWLQTPLGKKIVQYEIESSTPEAQEKLEEITSKQINSLGTQGRLNLLMKLDDVSHTTNFAVDMQLNMQIAMLSAMYSANPSNPQIPIESLVQEAQKSRFKLKAIIQQNTLAGSFYIYRDTSDSELQQYIDYHEQEATKKCNRIVMEALNESFIQSSKDMAEAIIKIKTAPTDESPDG